MANDVRRFKKVTKNAKHFNNNEMEVKTMLQTILNIIFYIPKKIYCHFEDFKNLKEENRKLKQEIKDRKNMAKRIIYKCDDYMKKNSAISHMGFKQIKELASIFPNDTANS